MREVLKKCNLCLIDKPFDDFGYYTGRNSNLVEYPRCRKCRNARSRESYRKLNPLVLIKDLEGEIWKSVPTHPDYAVSNLGRVKSKKHDRETIMSTKPDLARYLKVDLYLKNINTCYTVHRLVALLFCEGRTPEKHIVNHKDGDIYNNAAANLEWCTPSHNNVDGFNRNGRKYQAIPKHTMLNITFLIKNGFSQRKVTKILQVPYQYVRCIALKGKHKERSFYTLF